MIPQGQARPVSSPRMCDLLPLKIHVVQSNRLYNLKSNLVDMIRAVSSAVSEGWGLGGDLLLPRPSLYLHLIVYMNLESASRDVSLLQL